MIYEKQKHITNASKTSILLFVEYTFEQCVKQIINDMIACSPVSRKLSPKSYIGEGNYFNKNVTYMYIANTLSCYQGSQMVLWLV